MEWHAVLRSLVTSAFGDRVQPSVRMTALHSLAMIADSSGNLLLERQVDQVDSEVLHEMPAKQFLGRG